MFSSENTLTFVLYILLIHSYFFHVERSTSPPNFSKLFLDYMVMIISTLVLSHVVFSVPHIDVLYNSVNRTLFCTLIFILIKYNTLMERWVSKLVARLTVIDREKIYRERQVADKIDILVERET